ncbi:MAG: TIGR01212 family radical SAM protein [Prevotella sp.]|nr:TIGR01212 family radical SAM protein [Staphylococcus sp.]MCM1350355.1 TIGR01212 family radical SAM protein [Prevotella sp.]
MNPLFTNEKHYITLDNYLKQTYHHKVFKVALNGNFSCPNRDGTISTEGCLFCSKAGSGDFAGDKTLPIREQFDQILERMQSKWPEGDYIAYFQANTNTYDTLENLKARYDQIVKDGVVYNNKIKILSIATRPDCLTEEIVAYLALLNQTLDVWVELGFQTMHESSAHFINRGYDNTIFEQAVKLLRQYHLSVIVHIINGLPFETQKQMIQTVDYLNRFDIQGIKIHMLHIMKETPLASYYVEHPFHILTLEEYVDIVVTQLRHLKPSIVIHRITGDAPKKLLIAPEWTLKKFVVMNEIDKKMRKEHLFQGDLCIK